MTERLVFAIFLSVVAAGLIITVLAQQAGQAKKEIGEVPSLPPDYAALLPSGSETGRVAELVDSPTPTYVAGYSNGGRAGLALVVWSKEEGRYGLRSLLTLEANGESLARVETISIERPGTGVPTLVLARGPRAGANGDAVMIAVRQTDGIHLARTLDKDGDAGVAAFPVGVSGIRSEELDMADIDGDGVLDIVATSRNNGSAHVYVYVWANDRLEYQEELSWAMTMDKQLFPEPPRS